MNSIMGRKPILTIASFRIPKALKAKVNRAAKKAHVPIVDWVTEALEEKLSRPLEEPEAEAEEDETDSEFEDEHSESPDGADADAEADDDVEPVSDESLAASAGKALHDDDDSSDISNNVRTS